MTNYCVEYGGTGKWKLFEQISSYLNEAWDKATLLIVGKGTDRYQ